MRIATGLGWVWWLAAGLAQAEGAPPAASSTATSPAASASPATTSPAASASPAAAAPAASASASSAPSAAAARSAGETLLERVAAVVDGRPVLYSEVKTKVDKGPLVVVSEFPLEEAAPQFDRALQDSINFELILSKAKELELDVRDDQVEAEINTFLEGRHVTRELLMEQLANSGVAFADYKKDFKDQMILRMFQGRVIAPLVKITDKDVETYYMKKAGTSTDLLELVLRQILIGTPANAAPEVLDAKRKLAQEVHQKVTDGTPFAEAVKIYSDEPGARENAGLMAPVKARDLTASIRTAVENLEVGQFTQPIKTSLGYHIFLLQEKKLASSDDFLAKKRQLEMELRTTELMEQTRHWLSEQRQKTKVEILPSN